MKRYVILGVDSNPTYIRCLPIVCWAWKQLGWIPVICSVNNAIAHLRIEGAIVAVIDAPAKYKTGTIAQVSRLYATALPFFSPDDYVMTSDADMLPLADFWHYGPNEITVWGHDLSGFTHYPICYIGMPVGIWRRVMKLDQGLHKAMLKDLEEFEGSSDDFQKHWFADQNIVTRRINEATLMVRHFYRGVYQNGYAINRVDRSAWTLNHNELWDCHMPHDLSGTQLSNLLRLLVRVWPTSGFSWYTEYLNQSK